jgi:hypothetical protein
MTEQATLAFDFAARQLRHLVETHPDYLPVHTVRGKWGCEQEDWTRWCGWCEGFLGGRAFSNAVSPIYRRMSALMRAWRGGITTSWRL